MVVVIVVSVDVVSSFCRIDDARPVQTVRRARPYDYNLVKVLGGWEA